MEPEKIARCQISVAKNGGMDQRVRSIQDRTDKNTQSYTIVITDLRIEKSVTTVPNRFPFAKQVRALAASIALLS